MRGPLVVALALTCLAALPAGAAGATAKIVIGDSCGEDVACGKYGGGRPLTIVTYVGAPGEANRVTATGAGETITLSDPGATVTAEAPCRSIDPHSAVCQGGGSAPIELSGFTAQLGDGDDMLTIAPRLRVGASLLGEGGDDVLTGDDTLHGELGVDLLDGGAGADLLDGDPPQGDAYYTPIVKLRRDVLRGGSGNDLLSDTGGANVLAGGSGDDLMRGGVDADRLVGGSGADRIEGAPGAIRCAAAPASTACSAEAGLMRCSGAAGSTDCRAAPDRTGSPPATAWLSASRAAAGATRPASTRKTACGLAKTCVPAAILPGVDQAFQPSSAAYSLTPRRTANA